MAEHCRLSSGLRKTVVLVGMMGAGKTAVGGALAQKLGVAFLDSDEEIRRASNMEIAEIFDRDGEDFFREREGEILARLLEGEPCILSTGGGAFLKQENRNQIAEKGVSVWLKVDLEILWSRVRHKDTRPLLRTSNPKETLRQLCDQRECEYAKSDLTVEALASYSIDDMANRVLEVLASRPDVLEIEK